MAPEKEYLVKKGHNIHHNSKEYKEGETVMLTEEQAKKLHVESADEYHARLVLEGKGSYADSKTPVTKELVEKIKAARSVETVEVLMSLSTVKAVATAGNKRLEELAKEPVKKNEGGDDGELKALLVKVKAAKTAVELSTIEKEAVDKLSIEGIDKLGNAVSDRKAELKI